MSENLNIISKVEKEKDIKEEFPKQKKLKIRSGGLPFGDEMEIGVISKGSRAKTKNTDNIKTKKIIVKNYNEQGQRLTKSGKIDKRVETCIKNLEKSSHYKEIIAKKNALKNDKVVYTPIVHDTDDSDDDLNFEIETEEVEKPVENPVEKPVVNDILINLEIEKRKKFDEKMFNLENENKKLKDSLIFNNHLTNIDRMSRRVKILF